jgi:hypothetical protein
MVKPVGFTTPVTFTVTSKDARTEMTGFTALRNTRRFSDHYQVTAKSVMRKVLHNPLCTLDNARILLRIDSDHTLSGVYRIRLIKFIALTSEGSLHDDVKDEIVLDRSVQSQDGMNEGYNSKERNRIAKEGKVSQRMASFKLASRREELFLYFTDVLDELSNQASIPMPDIWINETDKLVAITLLLTAAHRDMQTPSYTLCKRMTSLLWSSEFKIDILPRLDLPILKNTTTHPTMKALAWSVLGRACYLI